MVGDAVRDKMLLQLPYWLQISGSSQS
jgi:hypothetical protein